jgi:hypothetical protein
MEYFIDTMTERLWEKGIRPVFERRRLEVIQTELKYSLDGYVSDETAQRIGQMTGVNTVIYGSLRTIDNYQLVIRTSNVETTQMIFPKTYNLQMDARLAGLLGIPSISPADSVRNTEKPVQTSQPNQNTQPQTGANQETTPETSTGGQPVSRQPSKPEPSYSLLDWFGDISDYALGWLGDISEYAYRNNFMWAASLKWDDSEGLGFDIPCFGINYSAFPFMSFGANTEIVEVVPFGISGLWGLELSAGLVFPIIEYVKVIGNCFIGFPGFAAVGGSDAVEGYVQKDWLNMYLGYDTGLLLDFEGDFCIEIKYQGEWYSKGRYVNSISIGLGFTPDFLRPWW